MQINHITSKIDEMDFDFLAKLTDEQLKDISPYVLTMWMAGAIDNHEVHVIMTDLLVNQRIFSLSKHPRLALMLISVANGGMGKTRYRFKNIASKTQPKHIGWLADQLNCSYDVATEYYSLLDDSDKKRIQSLIEAEK